MDNMCDVSIEDKAVCKSTHCILDLQPVGLPPCEPRPTTVNELQSSTVNNTVNCDLETDALLGPSDEKEYGNVLTSRASASQTITSHCLICNTIFTHDITNTLTSLPRHIYVHSTFAPITWNRSRSMPEIKSGDSPKSSVFEKIGHILGKSLGSINLHSESICRQCFNMLVIYSEAEAKLFDIRSQVLTKFEKTSKEYETTGKTLEIVVTTSGEQESSTIPGLKPVLIITEEGKVVDENGKEKETIFKVGKSAFKSEFEKSVTNRSIKQDTRTYPKQKSSHKVKQPYLCPVCGKSFRAFSHRVEHMLIHLGEKPWNCDKCKKKFRTKSALKNHSVKHTGVRPFVCTNCSKSFADKYYFDQHCRIHSGERPFECSYCVRLFARKKDLAVHMRAHTGDKPFKCSHCSKTFAVKSRLDRHSRTHSGIKPHTCEFCNKSFSRQDDCKVHVRQHTGERPFCCSYCEKTFTNKSNCLVHIRTHTGPKVFKCSLCSASYNRQSKVDEHMATTHSLNKQGPDTEGKQTEDQGTISTSSTDSQPSNVSRDNNIQSVSVSAVNQPLLCEESLNNFALSDTQNSSTNTPVQEIGLSMGQITQLWSAEGSSIGATTFVNIPPGTFVNIITDSSGIIST